jgi:hypothetical protein
MLPLAPQVPYPRDSARALPRPRHHAQRHLDAFGERRHDRGTCPTSQAQCTTNTLQDDLNTAQKLLLDLVRDLKTSGCESVETVRWRNILVDRILPARALVVAEPDVLVAWRVVLWHAKQSEEVGRMCYGEDRGEFRVLRQTREGTEATILMLEEASANEEAARDLADGSDGEEE